MIEIRDLLYFVGGIALLGLTALPLVSGKRMISVPMIYVLAGAALALFVPDWPVLDPRRSDVARLLIEHLTELIVIIALAGAGLSVDRRADGEAWQHSWVLLGVVMPATIGVMFLLGTWAGLGAASALLLAAALAPTDPVLAREVAVSGPNDGDEDDVRVSLTIEAGLNDGLAFPFIWLAILVAGAAAASDVAWGHWIAVDVLWRVAAALGIGWAIGKGAGYFVHGPWGDARMNGENAGLVALGTTFLAYGAAEMIDGYGFLAVFVAARIGRGVGRDSDNDDYTAKPHRYADQFEKILLAILLLWLGGFAASGALVNATWQEWALALGLIFVVRPLIAILALAPTRGDRYEHFAIAFFGIRGLGSIFYIAYAIGHAKFESGDALWRIAMITILVSIVIHGSLAPFIMDRFSSGRRKARSSKSDRAS